jgi:hypothetical protein
MSSHNGEAFEPHAASGGKMSRSIAPFCLVASQQRPYCRPIMQRKVANTRLRMSVVRLLVDGVERFDDG